MNFDARADELQHQEFTRLDAARTPRIEVFCSMTAGAFVEEVSGMMERLNHAVATLKPWLVTTKDGLKFVTACSNPAEQTPINMPAIRRLHQAVVAAGAYKGIYVTPRSFTPEALHYAAHAPINLVDGPLLIKSMQLSRRGVLLPQTYKAMCRQCGEIVEHRLDKDDPLPCPNGHFVAPPISRASLKPYRPPPGTPQPAVVNPAPVLAPHLIVPHPPGVGPSILRPRNANAKTRRRRTIRTHNHRLRARAMKEQRDG